MAESSTPSTDNVPPQDEESDQQPQQQQQGGGSASGDATANLPAPAHDADADENAIVEEPVEGAQEPIVSAADTGGGSSSGAGTGASTGANVGAGTGANVGADAGVDDSVSRRLMMGIVTGALEAAMQNQGLWQSMRAHHTGVPATSDLGTSDIMQELASQRRTESDKQEGKAAGLTVIKSVTSTRDVIRTPIEVGFSPAASVDGATAQALVEITPPEALEPILEKAAYPSLRIFVESMEDGAEKRELVGIVNSTDERWNAVHKDQSKRMALAKRVMTLLNSPNRRARDDFVHRQLIVYARAPSREAIVIDTAAFFTQLLHHTYCNGQLTSGTWRGVSGEQLYTAGRVVAFLLRTATTENECVGDLYGERALVLLAESSLDRLVRLLGFVANCFMESDEVQWANMCIGLRDVIAQEFPSYSSDPQGAPQVQRMLRYISNPDALGAEQVMTNSPKLYRPHARSRVKREKMGCLLQDGSTPELIPWPGQVQDTSSSTYSPMVVASVGSQWQHPQASTPWTSGPPAMATGSGGYATTTTSTTHGDRGRTGARGGSRGGRGGRGGRGTRGRGRGNGGKRRHQTLTPSPQSQQQSQQQSAGVAKRSRLTGCILCLVLEAKCNDDPMVDVYLRGWREKNPPAQQHRWKECAFRLQSLGGGVERKCIICARPIREHASEWMISNYKVDDECWKSLAGRVNELLKEAAQ